MIQTNRRSEIGSEKSLMITTIGLIVALVIALSLSVWFFMQYTEQKTDVDAKIDDAVATAKKVQADEDEVKFIEREKEKNRQFIGPDDYGRVSFNYPKTWSVFVSKDAGNGGSYEAYLNPVAVPPIGSDQQFALRVLIEEKDYDNVINSYDSLVKKGDLKSSSVKADGVSGTRLDGNFTKNIRGMAVVFKIRDKTLTIRSDANTFKKDFDALIATIKFNE